MNVIPLPNNYQINDGFFVIDSLSTLNYSHELAPSVDLFISYIKSYSNYSIKEANYAIINFLLDFSLSDEQYLLDITESSITLTARSNKGAFYGVQTIIQLLISEKGILKIPCLTINDQPRFSYRGFMLDVARHFFPKEDIFRLIDIISFHKLNVLHLHLTDDQGWRIEIEKYPLLTEIGSKRKATIQRNKQLDNQAHQGYYTKQDIRDIVQYSKEKHVEIIPEIDMPGHMNALIASYPHTMCTNEKVEVRSSFGISKHILCAGNLEVYKMLEDILLEVIELFDSKYVHIGGDEVPKDNWIKCDKCKNFIKEKNLKDVNELQTYLFNYFSNFLKDHKKVAIGWNDCIDEKLNKSSIIQHWKPFTNKKTVNEINAGRRTIISNFFYLYLDYPYALTPLKKTYNFNPILKGVIEENNIIGIEAPLWTEWVKTKEKLDFQCFPRLAAISEIGWTNEERKDYGDFIYRLKHLYKFYEKMGIEYAKKKEKKLNIISRVIKTYKWLKVDDDVEIKKN